jgi:hypothetical protein
MTSNNDRHPALTFTIMIASNFYKHKHTSYLIYREQLLDFFNYPFDKYTMSTVANSESGAKRAKKVNTQPPQPRIEEIEDVPSKENTSESLTSTEKETNSTTLPKERKKPRKLVRSSPSSQTVPKTQAENTNATEPADVSLETRLQRLEQKYHGINKRLDTNAREIGRLQASTKSSKPAGKLNTDTTYNSPGAHQETLQNTISSLDGPNRRHKGELIEEDDDIETIPRLDGGPVAEQRSVALTGNYKIPLPSTLSTEDVKAIQSGIAAAGSVAREITAAIRTNGTEMPQPGPQAERGNIKHHPARTNLF